MKISTIILCLLISATSFAQKEWGSLNKNKLTMKQIAPIWPGCEAGNSTKRDACFNEMLMKHIVANLSTLPTNTKITFKAKLLLTLL